MSVSTTNSVSTFVAQYVESQNRTTDGMFSTTEDAAISAALAEFQLSSMQLQKVRQLLDDLELMRGMVANQTLSAGSLDAVELSIQTLLQESLSNPVTAPTLTQPPVQSQPLSPAAQAFSNQYLTSTYLENATVWPGADTKLQSDLRSLDLAPIERAVVTQYMYSIADQRRYLAAMDVALKAPDGLLYATETDPGYQAYLGYVKARDATAAAIDGYVATAQGILAHAFPVTMTGFDQIPWSVRLTDPMTAVPPANASDLAKFEIAEDKVLMSQLGSQAYQMEGQITQLSALLLPKRQPPLLSEQIIQYSTQLWDLRQQLKLISADVTALQARLDYNTAVVAGAAPSTSKALTLDMNVSVAQTKLAAFAPTPIDNGTVSEPVPADLQQKLSADKAAYAALVADTRIPAPTDPAPTLQLIQSYIDRLTYLMEVPAGRELTDQQIDELGLLYAHRQALRTQLQNVNAELAALKARIDYAEAVVVGARPYASNDWDRLTRAVSVARARREAGELIPPTASALTTPPPETVAWKLSGSDPARINITRIDNFLLDEDEDDLVYERLAEFSGYVGAVERDTQTSSTEAGGLTSAINQLGSGSQKTAAINQQSALNNVINWLPTFAQDAATAYANAEAARTVTLATQVDSVLAGVDASQLAMLSDDYQLALRKQALAAANAAYYSTYSTPTTQRTSYYNALNQLSANVTQQAEYAELAGKATDPLQQQSYLDSLAVYQTQYEALLTTALARYFDYAYSTAPTASTWPRTLTSSMSDASKAAEVTSHYSGDVYAIIDPIPTTLL